jgi:hypothetical protein
MGVRRVVGVKMVCGRRRLVIAGKDCGKKQKNVPSSQRSSRCYHRGDWGDLSPDTTANVEEIHERITDYEERRRMKELAPLEREMRKFCSAKLSPEKMKAEYEEMTANPTRRMGYQFGEILALGIPKNRLCEANAKGELGGLETYGYAIQKVREVYRKYLIEKGIIKPDKAKKS